MRSEVGGEDGAAAGEDVADELLLGAGEVGPSEVGAVAIWLSWTSTVSVSSSEVCVPSSVCQIRPRSVPRKRIHSGQENLMGALYPSTPAPSSCQGSVRECGLAVAG